MANVLVPAGFSVPAAAQTSAPGAETVRPEGLDAVLELVATVTEVTGVAVIVFGIVAASFLFLRTGLSSSDWPVAFDRYRANLGRGILLGLELLVAADIIGTVAVRPTLDNVAVLGLIVLIRTFLSFSLEVEIEGKWPWRRAEGPRPEQFQIGSAPRPQRADTIQE